MTAPRAPAPAVDRDLLLAGANRTVARDVAYLLGRRYPPVVYGVQDAGYLPVFVMHSVRADDLTAKLSYLDANRYRTVRLDEAVRWIEGRGRLPPKAIALTIDDGRPSTWTVAAPLLERFGMVATAYVVPGYLEAGPVRPTLAEVWRGEVRLAEVEASEREDAQGFLRWSEVEAMHAGGAIDVQSHSMLHRRVFTGPRLEGFLPPRWHGPIFNAPREVSDRLAWTPARLAVAAGAPVFEHRPLLGARRAWIGGGQYRERCLEAVQERGPAFFAGRGWRRTLRGLRPRAGVAVTQWLDVAAEQQWELCESRSALEARLGAGTVRHFCYPNGAGDAKTIELARAAGYASGAWGLLEHEVTNRRGADPHLLARMKHDFILALPGDGRRSLLELLEAKVARRLRGEKGY